MKILLINTGNDAQIGDNANSQSYPPLGIVSLGTVLKDFFGTWVEVSLLDGQVDSMELLVRQMRSIMPDLVGISMYCTSVRNSVALVQEAKALGAITLLGNDHAAYHLDTLLNKVRDLDFVCTGDVGEETILPFVASQLSCAPPELVPNLAFRVDNEVYRSSGTRLTQSAPQTINPDFRGAFDFRINSVGPKALDPIPIPDRNLLDQHYWKSYLRNFKRQFRRNFDSSTTTGVATVNRARGCARSKQRCRYCGIADLTPRGSSAEIFWRDVRSAVEQVDASVMYEAFDSASSWPRLISSWANSRPEDLSNVGLFMYAQAVETSEEIVGIFKQLGVFCINSGFDSGDTTAVRLLKGPNDSAECNRRAAQLWTDAGIEMHVSFVLMGMGNEDATRRSLDRTVEFADWLASSTSVVSLDSAMFYPDRSAVVGSWIWNPENAKSQAQSLGWDFIDFDLLDRVSQKWRREVFLDPLSLCTDFAQICGVAPEILVEYNRRIHDISINHGINFGHSLAGAEPV